MRHTRLSKHNVNDYEYNIRFNASKYAPRCLHCNAILGTFELSKEICTSCYARLIQDREKRKKTREVRSKSGLLAVLKARINAAIARERKAGWGKTNITMSFLLELYDAQKGKCALSNQPLSLGAPSFRKYDPNTISIDRKDSTKGYTKDNIQFVTLWVNRAKNVHSNEEFITLCKQVVDYESNRLKAEASQEC